MKVGRYACSVCLSKCAPPRTRYAARSRLSRPPAHVKHKYTVRVDERGETGCMQSDTVQQRERRDTNARVGGMVGDGKSKYRTPAASPTECRTADPPAWLRLLSSCAPPAPQGKSPPARPPPLRPRGRCHPCPPPPSRYASSSSTEIPSSAANARSMSAMSSHASPTASLAAACASAA